MMRRISVENSFQLSWPSAHYTYSFCYMIHVFSCVIGKSHDPIVGCGLMVHGLAHFWLGLESHPKKPNDFRISFIKSNYWNIFSFNIYNVGGNLKANRKLLLHKSIKFQPNEYIFPLPPLDGNIGSAWTIQCQVA